MFSGTPFFSQKAIASSDAWIASEISFLIEKSYITPSSSSMPRMFFLCLSFLLMTIAIRVMMTVTALDTGNDTHSQ